jgi:ribosomal protein S18 acetylase RimI-like enzyme
MESFEDYPLDVSYMTVDVMTSRVRMGRVDYGSSVGAFAGDKLIGFLLVAVDTFNSELYAFDEGTGIIKEFRGQGVAGSMFSFALPKLKSMGIRHFMLEVLQENKAAIKAYEKAGFSIARDLNCYRIETKKIHPGVECLPEVATESISKSQLAELLEFLDYQVSWEYTYSAIMNIQEKIVIEGAFVDDACIGFIVFYPTLNWIFMLGIREEYRNRDIENLLLFHLMKKLAPDLKRVSLNNIPPDHRMCHILESVGFEIYTRQFEMVCSL